MSLANSIFDEFKKLEMDPWTDIHYVQLPIPDRYLELKKKNNVFYLIK